MTCGRTAIRPSTTQNRDAFSAKYQYAATTNTMVTAFASIMKLHSNTPNQKGSTRQQIGQFGDDFLMTDNPASPVYYQSETGIFRTGLWSEYASTDRYQIPSDPRTWVDAALPNFHEMFREGIVAAVAVAHSARGQQPHRQPRDHRRGARVDAIRRSSRGDILTLLAGRSVSVSCSVSVAGK